MVVAFRYARKGAAQSGVRQPVQARALFRRRSNRIVAGAWAMVIFR
jgi:hypothetical protein